MTTFSGRRTVTRWRTVRHRYTILCSPFNSMILIRAFLSSIGIVYMVLLAVHLNAGASLVISMAVSIFLLLIWWAWVRHWDVASSWQSISHRCSISLICVSVVNLLTIFRTVSFCVYDFFLLMVSIVSLGAFTMSFWSLLVILGKIIQLHFFFHLSESPIEIIFAMTSDVFIDLCFIHIGRFQTLGNSVQFRLLIFFFFTPPVWIHNSVHRTGLWSLARKHSPLVVRIVDLVSLEGRVSY